MVSFSKAEKRDECMVSGCVSIIIGLVAKPVCDRIYREDSLVAKE